MNILQNVGQIRALMILCYETNVCQHASRCTVEFWNLCGNIQQKLPRTNNAVKEYNCRMSTAFLPPSHIYEFTRRLKDEHEY